jgi:hypothetical protein
MTMRLPIKTLAAAVVAAAIPLAGPAAAAPLSPSQALNNAATGTIEQVQYRRWDRGYYGDGYYAYGAAPDGYYAYGAAPGYPVAPRYRYRSGNYGNGSSATAPGSSPVCDADRENATSYPSWMCR